MRTRNILALTLVAIVTLSTIGLGVQDTSIVGAQTEPELTVGSTSLGIGDTDTVDVNLSAAPNGLTGYQITVSLDDPSVANITNASVSDEFQPESLRSATIAPDGNSVVLKGTDATGNIQPGATDIPLASIELEGENPGQTNLSVSVDLIQDDETPPQQIFPAVTEGSVTVEGPNQPPTADAGTDRTVTSGTEVTLDGTGSTDPDEDTLSYEWTQTAGQETVVLEGNDTATPSFTAPAVDSETDLIFELTVTDESGETATDSVVIVVEPGNSPPVADAGNDLEVAENSSFQFEDTMGTDPDGDDLSYLWEQVSGPSVDFGRTDVQEPALGTPEVDEDTVVTLRFTVTDENGASDSDLVNLTIINLQSPPEADAGDDQVVTEGDEVTLNATGSFDPDGATLSYQWTQQSGPTTTLSGANTATPSFTAPAVDSETVLTFAVSVDDGSETDTDTVNVTVQTEASGGGGDDDGANESPVADAGESPGPAAPGSVVELDGTNTSDPDGDDLTYEWFQTAGPVTQISDAETPTPTFTMPERDEEARVVCVTLVVTDESGAQDSDEVCIYISPVADAGEDQTVDEGSSVELDASESTDPGIVAFSWQQTAGPSVSLSGANTATPSFTAPSVDTETTLTFEVTIDDGNAGTDTDIVNVTVQNVAGPANFAVSNLQAPGSATPGDTIEVSALVTNEGESEGTQAVDFRLDQNGNGILENSETLLSEDVTLGSDESTTVEFDVDTSGLAPRTYVHGVATENDTDNATITLESAVTNQPPTADAGDDQTVDENTTVELTAEGSSDPDGDSLTYSWTQASGPSVTLSDTSSATPSFTAPTVDADTVLSFEVEVADGNGGANTDVVNVTVENVTAPEPDNQPPTADAGDDKAVDEEANVGLDATESSDPDGDSLTYTWTQTAGPAVTLSGTSTATPSFTAPTVEADTVLTFEVEVDDENGGTDSDTVNVTVQNVTAPDPENQPPTADAGDDQTVDEGTSVELDATGSTDPDGDIVTHNWTQTAGPTVTLSDQFADSPTFTAPTVETETTLTFEVTARDGNGGTDTDTVNITVVPTNDPPTADAGEDQSVDEGSSVDLDATGSSDPNGDELSYAWRQVAGAGVTLSDTETATPSLTAPTVNSQIVLVFEVEVDDGNQTSTDTVNITVNPVEEPVENQPPTADAGGDQVVSEESDVTLDATGSSDPDGDDLTYAWTQTGGPAVTLSETNTAAPSLTAPAVDSATDLTFEVDVSDGNGESDTDTVTVRVEPVTEETAFFSVTSIDVPAEVTQGENLTVTGTVTNTGDATGTQTVEVRADLDGDGTLETLRAESVTLASGESKELTETLTVPSDFSPGTYPGGLFTEDSEQTDSIEVVAAMPEEPAQTQYTRDEISQAKYGYDFDDLSTETSQQVEELYLRQPFADGQGPADVKTREELANDRYGEDFDDLSRETTIELQAEFDAQFNDTGANAEYTRDEISQAKYGYDFDDLSTETSGQVEELYNRQPFAGDLTPSEVRTREEIADEEYGMDVDELSRETRIEIEQTYHEQFAETEGDQ